MQGLRRLVIAISYIAATSFYGELAKAQTAMPDKLVVNHPTMPEYSGTYQRYGNDYNGAPSYWHDTKSEDPNRKEAYLFVNNKEKQEWVMGINNAVGAFGYGASPLTVQWNLKEITVKAAEPEVAKPAAATDVAKKAPDPIVLPDKLEVIHPTKPEYTGTYTRYRTDYNGAPSYWHETKSTDPKRDLAYLFVNNREKQEWVISIGQELGALGYGESPLNIAWIPNDITVKVFKAKEVAGNVTPQSPTPSTNENQSKPIDAAQAPVILTWKNDSGREISISMRDASGKVTNNGSIPPKATGAQQATIGQTWVVSDKETGKTLGSITAQKSVVMTITADGTIKEGATTEVATNKPADTTQPNTSTNPVTPKNPTETTPQNTNNNTVPQTPSAGNSNLAQSVNAEVKQAIETLRATAQANGNTISFNQLGNTVKGLDKIQEALKNLGSQFEIKNAQFGSDGSITGGITFRSMELSVLLQIFEPDSLGIPQLALTIKFPTISGEVLPNDILQLVNKQFDIAKPTFVICTASEDIQQKLETASEITRAFYKDIQTDGTLPDLKSGVRYTMSASFRPGSQCHNKVMELKRHKVHIEPTVLIEGVLLKKFPTDLVELRTIYKDKGKALLEGLSLRATLPKFSTPLPSNGTEQKWLSAQAYLELTGKPSIEVGFTLILIPDDNEAEKATFLAKIRLDVDISEGTGTVTFVAKGEGKWRNALGLKGFNFYEATLVLSLDTKLVLGVGVQAKMGFNIPGIEEKITDMAGKITINLTSGIPDDFALRYGTPENPIKWNRDEVVIITNHIIRLAKPGATLLDGSKLPNFAIDKVRFSFALKEGDEDLKINSGASLAGELYFDDKKLVAVDGLVVWKDSPEFKLKGEVADFQLPVIKVSDVKIDVAVAAAKPTEAYFKFSAKADVSALRELGKKASDEILAAARTANSGFESAKTTLSDREAVVNSLNTELAAERRNALNEFTAAKQKIFAATTAVEDAKKSLSKIDNEISYAKRYVTTNFGLFKAQTQPDLPRVPILLGAKKTAEGVLSAAEATMKTVVSPGTEWAMNATGPDAHPKVIALNARIGSEMIGLKAAQRVVELSRQATGETLKVTAYAVANAGNVIMVESFDIKADIQAKSLADSSFNITIGYRYLDKPGTLTAKITGRDLSSDALVAPLKRQVGF